LDPWTVMVVPIPSIFLIILGNGRYGVNSVQGVIKVRLVVLLVVGFRIQNWVHKSPMLRLPRILLHPIPSQLHIDWD